MKTLSQKLQEYRIYRQGEVQGQTQEIRVDLHIISNAENEVIFKVIHNGIIGKGSTLTAAVNDFFKNKRESLSEDKEKAEKDFFNASAKVKTISELCE